MDSNYGMNIDVDSSHKLFSNLMQNLPGFFYCRLPDKFWTITSLMSNIGEITGYTPQEIINNKKIAFKSLVHPDDSERVTEIIDENLNAREPININYRIISKNGAVKWIHEISNGVYDDSGALSHIEGHIREITLEKNMNSIPVSKSYVDAVNKTSLVSMTDKDGKILYANDLFCQYAKYSSEELMGKDHRILNSGYHSKKFFADMWNTIKQGNIWRGEIKNKAKDGSSFWVDTIISPVYDENKNIERFLAIREVITSQKKEEQDLLLISHLLQHVTINSPAIIYISKANTNRTFMYISENVWREIGYEPKDFMNDPKNWMNNIHPDDSASVYEKFSMLDKVDELTLEYRFKLKNSDKYIWIQDQLRIINDDDGKPKEIIGFWFKIDQRKRAEIEIAKLNEDLEQKVEDRTRQLKMANKELEAFSYSVSHDLRAPLRGIDGFSQALLEDYSDALDTQGKNYLRRVRSASQKMSVLIDDFLTLARVSRASLNFSEVNLSEMATSITELLMASEPNRKAEINIQPGMTDKADPTLIKIVLQNLLENAWKFTSKKPKAKIEFGIKELDGRKTYFIKDNGAGFIMKQVDKIFAPFQRLHHEEEFPGTGIGLATVQRIINRHNSKVWAESEVEKGTIFYFTLFKKYLNR